MAVEGVDYAGSRPSPTGLFAAGKRFAIRYGGPGGSWKHLTASEARALTAAGLVLVANAEGSASGLLGGRAAGVDWARQADAHFRALGMPAGRPIYLSLDIDPRDLTGGQWAAVDAALDGAADVLGRGRVGIYGGYAAITRYVTNQKAVWYWQTYAWSGGRWHLRNHLEQYRNGVTVAGGTVDLCRAKVADYGQWTVGASPPQPEEDEDMTEEQARQLHNLDRLNSALLGGETTVSSLLLQNGDVVALPLAVAAQARDAARDAAAALAIVAELRDRPTPVVTDEQLERALRKVLGSVDGSPPPEAS